MKVLLISNDKILVDMIKGFQLPEESTILYRSANPDPLDIMSDVCNSGASILVIDDDFLKTVSGIFYSDNFKVEISNDIFGVQVCGLLKNVISLAIGIARGAKLSENAIAYIFTKGLKETVKIVKAFGGKTETVYGLAGVGDLVLTSMGTQSRNLKAGVMIGSGKTLQDVEKELGILPEGVASANALSQLVEKLGLDLPLAVTVEQIIRGKALPADLL